jgi:hypothetical protein
VNLLQADGVPSANLTAIGAQYETYPLRLQCLITDPDDAAKTDAPARQGYSPAILAVRLALLNNRTPIAGLFINPRRFFIRMTDIAEISAIVSIEEMRARIRRAGAGDSTIYRENGEDVAVLIPAPAFRVIQKLMAVVIREFPLNCWDDPVSVVAIIDSRPFDGILVKESQVAPLLLSRKENLPSAQGNS